jgi:transposase
MRASAAPAGAASAMLLVGTSTAVAATIAGYPVFTGQALRYALAAAILLAVVRHRRLPRARLTVRDVLLLIALAATGLAGFDVFLVEATRHAGPAMIAAVVGAVPLVLALVGPLTERRRPAPVERDPEAVARWHQETWPKVRAKAKADGGEILFADQVGIRSDQVTGRTWGEKGKTPVVRRSGNRFSVNAMSAISTKGRMHFMVFAESFTAEVMCRFLDRLAGHFDHKVHLVVDGHSAHRTKKVHDWLAAHPDDVELHFLPPYSPELNPDELVDADLKHSLPRQHRARDQAELAAETRRFFHRRLRQPHIVRGYFGGPHVRYALDKNPIRF